MKSLCYFLPLFLFSLISFNTLDAKDDCDSPSGLKVENTDDGKIKLIWTAVKEAKGYKLEVEDAHDNPAHFELETSTSDVYYILSGIKASSWYKFKVRTICKEDKSDWSEYFYFKSRQDHSSNPDNNPNGSNNSGTCSIPTGLIFSDITDTGATVSWDPVDGVLNYEIEVEDGENTPLFSFNQITSATTVSVSGLKPGGQYKAKVKSKCSNDNSEYSQWVFFNAGLVSGGSDSTAVDTTGSTSCEIPVGLLVTHITDTTAIVSWTKPAGVNIFEVEVEEEDSTQDFVFKLTTNQSAVALIGLIKGGSYKVKVKSKCEENSSEYTDWVFFTTGQSNPTDTSVVDTTGAFCDIPMNLQVSEIGMSSTRITWLAVPGVTTYELEVEDDENTPPFEFNIITGDTSILVSGLSPNGQYQVKVKSKCSNGFNSEYTDWVFFSTQNELRTPDNSSERTGLLKQLEEISIYPNPARENFRIELPEGNDMQKVNIKIFDPQGKLVWGEENIPSEVFPKAIPVGEFQNGLYHISLQTKIGLQTYKLMIAH
jgi:hypothetical protein